MRNAKLGGCRKPATYAKTLSITKISTLHLELRGDPTRSNPGSAGLATVTTCFPFGYGANLASVTSPHNLGFHPYSKEVRSLGHLEVFFTNCAPGRKGKKEENIASEQRCDIMIPQRHQHHNPSTLMPHRQGAELGGGKPVAPSGRKGRRTASSPDTPPPSPVSWSLRRGLIQAERSREPSWLCLPWSSQPPPQTPGSGAETKKRPKTPPEIPWAQWGRSRRRGRRSQAD